jgi:hypothetical protein
MVEITPNLMALKLCQQQKLPNFLAEAIRLMHRYQKNGK